MADDKDYVHVEGKDASPKRTPVAITEASEDEDDADSTPTPAPAQAKKETPAEARARAKRGDEDKKDDGFASMKGYVDLFGILMLLCGVALPFLMGDGTNGPPTLAVVDLDHSFYKTVLFPEKTDWDQGGPNGEAVSWVNSPSSFPAFFAL